MQTYEKTVAGRRADFLFYPCPFAGNKPRLTALLVAVSALVLVFAACSFGGNSRDDSGVPYNLKQDVLLNGGIVTRVVPDLVIVKKDATQLFEAKTVRNGDVTALWSVKTGTDDAWEIGIATEVTLTVNPDGTNLTVNATGNEAQKDPAKATVYVVTEDTPPALATGEKWPYGSRTDSWPIGVPRNMGVQIYPQVVGMEPGGSQSFQALCEESVKWEFLDDRDNDTQIDLETSFHNTVKVLISEEETAEWLTVKATVDGGDSPKYGTAVIRVVRSTYFVKNGGTGSGSKDKPLGTVAGALNKLKDQYSRYWPLNKDTDEEKEAKIVILEDMKSGPLVIDNNNYPSTIILSGRDDSIPNPLTPPSILKLEGSLPGSLITVKLGKKLILDNITLEGLGNDAQTLNSAALVTVTDDAKLIMKDETTITGNYNNVGPGGGVYVLGTFIMEGGTISGNTATGAGGGVFILGKSTKRDGVSSSTIYSTFSKTGGTIYGDESTDDSSKKNTASEGKAVYASHEGYPTTTPGDRRRNNTANDTDNLYYRVGKGTEVITIDPITKIDTNANWR